MTSNLDPNPSQIRTLLTLTILSLFLIIGTSITAAQDETESDLTVEIEEETIIDIQPDDLNYGTEGNPIPPGDIGGPDEEQEDTGSLFIENLGSVDITNIWYETSSATDMVDDPFLGTGTNDPSNFIALGRNEDDLETDGEYNAQFVDRKEYVMDETDTDSFIFIDVEDGWNLGRFKITNQEFFYAIEEVADGTNPDGVGFRMAETPRVVDTEGTGGQTGTTDFTNDGNDYQDLSLSADGVVQVEIQSTDPDGSEPIDPAVNYCASADFDDGDEAPASVRFIQWNPKVPGCEANGAEYGNEGTNLAPGDILTQDIRVFVPFGVPADDPLDGTLTILAES